MPCLKLNARSTTLDCDVAKRLFRSDRTIQFATSGPLSRRRGGRDGQLRSTCVNDSVTERSRSVTRCTGCWNPVSPPLARMGWDSLSAPARQNVAVPSRRGRKAGRRRGLGCLAGGAGGSSRWRQTKALSRRTPCAGPCDRAVSTRLRSPPARHGTSPCTCRACPPRCRAWCG